MKRLRETRETAIENYEKHKKLFRQREDRQIDEGVWALSDVGGGDFLTRKNCAMPECVSVEIGM